jgi:hypothetical protein
MADLTDVIEGLMHDVMSLPAVNMAADLRVKAIRLAEAVRDGTAPVEAARELEAAAIEALESDGWFRVHRAAQRIVNALTATDDPAGTTLCG